MTYHPNWFKDTGAQALFEKYLSHGYSDQKIDALQIGAFTGDASIWLLDNVLAHPESTLTDVDIWKGDPGLDGFNWETAYIAYKEKMESYSDKLTSRQMMSDQFFKQNKKMYDIIYIDGDHTARSVLRDAVNAFDCLRDGGILIFDDYVLGYNEFPSVFCSKVAIDAFLDIHWFEVEKIYEGSQMWLRKKLSDLMKDSPILDWERPQANA